MTQDNKLNLLFVGESDVGKTHYGAQLLIRLKRREGALRMPTNRAATNLSPFETVLQCLNEGRAAPHTGRGIYVESCWPIVDQNGTEIELIWPDYAGEQIRDLSRTRLVNEEWRKRIVESHGWIIILRLARIDTREDIFSRPLAAIHSSTSPKVDFRLSDQARMVELLQIMLYTKRAGNISRISEPSLSILLSCWDEIDGIQGLTHPEDLLSERLPLLYEFITANWISQKLAVYGLSALEKPLREDSQDSEYIDRGPASFGYVVKGDGSHTSDLTFPISGLVASIKKRC